MAIKFKKEAGVVKHAGLQFAPGVTYAFEDPDAEPYFKAAGWADDSKDDPVIVFTEGECPVDPFTVFADGEKMGQRVLTDTKPSKSE